jgi:mutator protein MutT
MSKFFKINVSTVIFNSEGKILIQKRSPNEEVFPNLWGIPGGTVEMSDKSVVDALKREVKEEVGVEIDNISLYGENLVAKEMYGVFYLVYVSRYMSGEPKALDGTSEVLWVEENQIDNYEFTPTTKKTILKSFIWKKSQ